MDSLFMAAIRGVYSQIAKTTLRECQEMIKLLEIDVILILKIKGTKRITLALY